MLSFKLRILVIQSTINNSQMHFQRALQLSGDKTFCCYSQIFSRPEMTTLKFLWQITAFGFASSQTPPLPRLIGSFDLQFAAYIEAFPKTDPPNDPRDLYTLFITTFEPSNFWLNNKSLRYF